MFDYFFGFETWSNRPRNPKINTPKPQNPMRVDNKIIDKYKRENVDTQTIYIIRYMKSM